MDDGHKRVGSVDTASDELLGSSLGSCAVERLLGQGGMARVYLARQPQLDRYVALKVLPPYYAADTAFVERFQQEARAMARLSHPHIVTVHDAGEDQGKLYIVMEYLSGGSLDEWMRQPLPLSEVARVIRQVADALAYAHARNIVHRDVKPVNILLDSDRRAVLSDFGIAKMLESSGILTHSGAAVGTPEYMSPEQCQGIYIDTRADIYALGVVLYELLTGRTPFEAENFTAIAHAHIYEPVPPPSRFNPRISPAVQSVILKALEKEPAERFQDAREMALAFDEALAAQSPLAPSVRVRRPANRGQHGAALEAQVCAACGAAHGAQVRFCTRCGTALGGAHQQPLDARPHRQAAASGAATICPRCANANRGGNRFCTRCGATLT